jgi:hypothetical protein
MPSRIGRREPYTSRDRQGWRPPLSGKIAGFSKQEQSCEIQLLPAALHLNKWRAVGASPCNRVSRGSGSRAKEKPRERSSCREFQR